jgi:hypothetical protein
MALLPDASAGTGLALTDGVYTEGVSRQAFAGDGEARSFAQVFGLASSATLHGLIGLLLLLAAAPRGVEDSRGTVELVPVKIEVTGIGPHAEPANAPRHEAPSPSAPSAATDSDVAADSLETKLQALAKLRLADTPQPASPSSAPESTLSTVTDDTAPGMRALRDFIRGQVERHWSLDLSALGKEEFSIPIRIEITSTGSVLKAEIIDNSRSADPTYREVASSARNAVLSASPLTLPSGRYAKVMQLVLYLDPRASLR